MSYSKRFMAFFSLMLLLGGALYVAGGAAADEQEITEGVNLFIQKDKLLASDKESGSEFGSVMALTPDGQYLVVGAPRQDVDGKSSQGQVYVYENDGQNGWTERQILTASDGEAQDQFGVSIAIAADNTLIVGVPNDDEGGTNVGSAYVFAFDNGMWSEQQHLVVSDTFAFPGNELIGTSLAITPDGNTAFVGAPGVENSSGTAIGSVYIFERTDDTWAQINILDGPDSNAARFGQGLGISGDGNILVIGGQYREGSSGLIERGRAYLYQDNGTGWAETQVLTPSETTALDEFGKDFAFNQDGSVLLIGASHESIGSPGKAYIYTEGGGVWSEQQVLNVPAGTQFGHFGAAVAVDDSGDHLAIGAWLNKSGGIHRYERSGDLWNYTQTVITADDRQEQLGYAVALNGDATVLVGGARSAHTDSDSFDNVGAIYSYGDGGFIYLPLVIHE